jgi:hypothetical protein
MTEPIESEIDWTLCTWKGSRRRQHQEFHAIPFRRKLELIEEMNEAAVRIATTRHAQGLAYVDPYTGERVPRRAPLRQEPFTPGTSRESS